ncbi:MAG: transcriptional repressor [Bacteroidaceae bacterium]|nr:transcriptional repressor [Bacteroidaceae bacterium]
MDKNEEMGQAMVVLTDYLHVHGLRSTAERNALLKAVCTYEGYFNPESLSIDMLKKHGFRVCRATVYNNLRLFEEAGLVQKVWLNGEIGYRRCWSNKHSIHLICSECGSIVECTDDRVRFQIESMRKKRFVMTGYLLSIHGLCGKCSAALKRKRKKMEKIYSEKNGKSKD